MEYSRKVKILLEYLELNQSISISKFSRMAFLPRNAAENIMADLIYFGSIEAVYADNHFVYSLKSRNVPESFSIEFD
jgi:hypothetical protein